MAISRELTLAIACCRWAYERGDRAPIAELCSGVDWPLFVHLARFHRVQGLIWACLSAIQDDLPRDVASRLASDAASIAAANLKAAVESRVLLEALNSAGIPAMFVKGLTLGAIAYCDPTIKSAVDIDLLVAAAQLEDTAVVLDAAGYRLVHPAGAFNADRLRSWHVAGKESTWVQSDRRLQVDLHTRLSDHPDLIPSIGLQSRVQIVDVLPGIRLPTLNFEELVAYLCVHGASSAWFRLKWVTDFAALLSGKSGSEIERLYGRSHELGAGRSAAQAFLIADKIYGTLDAAPELRAELLRGPAQRWLFKAALHQLTGRRMPIEPTSRPWGTLLIHATQFLLQPGWRFASSEFARQARAAMR